jgi:hypothetical protein
MIFKTLIHLAIKKSVRYPGVPEQDILISVTFDFPRSGIIIFGSGSLLFSKTYVTKLKYEVLRTHISLYGHQ